MPVLAHALLITWGYAITAHRGLIGQACSLLTSYPDVLMATVAAGLLVAVGIAAARAARHRLRYQTWHFIHLYTYLAIALAFSHQFANGAEFMFSRPARVLWSAMYLVVGASLLWYRLLVPIRQALHVSYGWFRSSRKVRRSSQSGSPAGIWPACAPNLASSFAGGS